MEKQVIQSVGFRNIVENGEVTGMRKECTHHWHPMEPATLIVKKPGGLKQGFHDLTYGFCCTHSYMPPFMEALEDPDKPAVIYFREFGQNTNSRRLLIV